MSKFQNFEEIYSVLYVDFDNIYTRLNEQDPALARTFATNPQRWMRWLDGHALRMMYGDGVRRRILKKCCYLNPHRYHEFRPFFIRAAFQVVDCPPLTNHGKTSADIHLVMDCMDALAHVTRFDEFIILSGDADFTPLLLRIQEHARRSLVLSVGYTSPAYAAACSWRIREDWFIAQALEDPRPEDHDPGNGRQDSRQEDRRDPRNDSRNEGRAAAQGERTPVFRQPRVAGGLTLAAPKRSRLVEVIKHLIADSSVPVPLPSVAQMLQREMEISPDWFGAGTLRDLIAALDIAPLELSRVGQGYVYDPERHERPEDSNIRDNFRQRLPELYEFALSVHRLTDLPLLHPEHYSQLFAVLADEINSQGFSRSQTIHHVEDRCMDEGLPVTSAQISFVLSAVISAGLALPRKSDVPSAGLTETALRRAFYKRAVELCRLSQFQPDKKDLAMLAQWLGTAGQDG